MLTVLLALVVIALPFGMALSALLLTVLIAEFLGLMTFDEAR